MLSPLQPDEVDFIRAMGDHVGVDITLTQLRAKSIQQLEEEALAAGKVYMIPPDEKGCVFLQKMNGEHHCRICRLRPRTCRGFRCNLPNSSFFLNCLAATAHLLGQESFGIPFGKAPSSNALPPGAKD